jgi:hypothetical protein
MAKTVTVREVYLALEENLRKRPDLGLGKAVVDVVLESPNPFEPQAARRPQRWFVFVSVMAAALAGSFLYFNFWR